MRIYLDCIPCFVRQALDAARCASDDEAVHEKVMRGTIDLIKELDMSQSPPLIGQKIHRLIRDLTGVEDPYYKVKHRFNNTALRLYPKMRRLIMESENPIAMAVCLAIAGNIIDFGVKSHLDESDLEETIEQCITGNLSGLEIDEFKEAVDKAENILYLADNAGEIVFDRLLIEQLAIDKITVAVKGSPVINDATMEDAIYAGLVQIVEVIDNGSDAPGTVLESCSKNFLEYFEKADLVISKGQGNYETLSDVDKNIFFILKAKCSVISGNIGCDVGEMILRKSKFKKTLRI